MTIKIKGDKARIEASPQLTTIFDRKTGEVINVMNDQKTIMRFSPEKMKAVTDMLTKFSQGKAGTEKPKLRPTGQKETINGYETEQYTYGGPDFQATCWVAPNYPGGAAILSQLQSIKSEMWNAANTMMPDYRDFPGLPIRTKIVMTMGNKPGTGPFGQATAITSTITSVSQAPISDSEFAVPSGYKEMQLPNVPGNKGPAPAASPAP